MEGEEVEAEPEEAETVSKKGDDVTEGKQMDTCMLDGPYTWSFHGLHSSCCFLLTFWFTESLRCVFY